MEAAMTVSSRRVRICGLTTMVPGSRPTGSGLVPQAFAEALRAAGPQTLVVGYRRTGTDPPLHPDDVVAGDRPIETREAGPRAALWVGAARRRGPPRPF